ncbi:TPA: hypothetical protein L4942_000940 [Pseudomonas aeruginosa]|jgi:predicted RNA-binding Zn-ribbon protein involved in translation (DUF1610 family)|uniref:Uncharacterized protein n=1 Tax=Stutzerimonas stutzeri KOS6 TaxID=1218352 RepID=A0A061JP23_STUST|nr:MULTISPECIES: hypothetical protein [Pseudomonadaceae]MBX3596269.1 hypothetical protein [Rhizobiaceae bacterium]EWC39929.1 hypothetical protein B597_017885 [Stutzerimonas stutzeri KOS6]MDI3878143.1 hypothetical protein [Pseudomonas aeruginosa]MDI4050023.1 hypothetical protein [Pseudomonas aeruginosa]MDI4199929.1 hypothetical protein [Pseudomonas aeruginosa]
MTFKADKYNRSVSLNCPTCGSTEFSHDGADGQTSELFTCGNCGLQISKDDLIRANDENVQAHAKEIGQAVVKDLQKELHESLKRAFRGSKNIKIR